MHSSLGEASGLASSAEDDSEMERGRIIFTGREIRNEKLRAAKKMVQKEGHWENKHNNRDVPYFNVDKF